MREPYPVAGYQSTQQRKPLHHNSKRINKIKVSGIHFDFHAPKI